jgi:hypothetical protein
MGSRQLNVTGRGGLIGPRGLVFSLLYAVLVCWPTWLTGSIFVFPDSSSYLRGGEVLWNWVGEALPLSGSETQTADSGAFSSEGNAVWDKTPDGSPRYIRSLLYSGFSYAALAIAGPELIILIQAALAAFMMLALYRLNDETRYPVVILGAIWMLFATQLPWHAVTLMPDIFAALIVIYAAILIREFDELTWWQNVMLATVASIAIAAHYGHPPIALGLFSLLFAYRLIVRSLTGKFCVGALIPLAFAPLTNLGGSAIALEEPSIAPLRLPIALARSIQDGPARWYLEEACPEADLAFCEVFSETKHERLGEFLWGPEGIESLSQQQMAAIRREEAVILWRAFRAYPLQQTRALARNVLLTLSRTTAYIGPADGLDEDYRPVRSEATNFAASTARKFNALFPWTILISIFVFVGLLCSRRLSRDQYEIACVVIAGILINAVIFGGLSAPADRYNSRLIWLIPFVCILFLSESRSSSRQS